MHLTKATHLVVNTNETKGNGENTMNEVGGGNPNMLNSPMEITLATTSIVIIWLATTQGFMTKEDVQSSLNQKNKRLKLSKFDLKFRTHQV